MQNHYNLIYREEEREMMGLCASEEVGVIPWSPLARGRLARPLEEQSVSDRIGKDEFGKTLYTKSVESNRQVIERVGEVAAAHKVPRAQVTLAWMLHKPYVTSPIIGATRPQHLEDAIGALELKLSAEEIGRLEEPYVPHSVSGFG
jgi:aryl-alcohol dehydrogenase-like predicted oxidoreductase